MIPVAFLIGAAVITAIAVAAFWKEIAAWISKVMERLPASVKENLQGAIAFVEKIGVTLKNLMVYYSYREDTQKWTETTVSKEVDPSNVPEHIRKKIAQSNKVDITAELQEKLELKAG